MLKMGLRAVELEDASLVDGLEVAPDVIAGVCPVVLHVISVVFKLTYSERHLIAYCLNI